MASLVQCEYCGAILAEEDIYCGECGAPHRLETDRSAPATVAQVDARLPLETAPAAPARPQSSEMGWRVAAIFLVVLGIIACLSGLLAFVLFGSMESEATTKAEDWLYSALCCLLPIGGTGAILAVVGGAIWYTRLRNR